MLTVESTQNRRKKSGSGMASAAKKTGMQVHCPRCSTVVEPTRFNSSLNSTPNSVAVMK